MKRTIFTVLLLGAFAFTLCAQNDITQLQNKITQLESLNAKLTIQSASNKKAILNLTKQLTESQATIMQLQTDVATSTASMQQLTADFEKRIQKNEVDSGQKIDHLDRSISNTTIYWIIAFLVVACATFFVYRRLKNILSKEKETIAQNIKSSNEQLLTDFSQIITKNNEDLKYTFSGDVKRYSEILTDKITKSNEDLRKEFDTNLKLATEAFNEQKNKLENQIKVIQTDMLKAKPKAEII